ncbi:hypothetical protein S40293_08903 [Stachybotrys chartarum IBT 40293]|nr:hypothetical protein S40293_08903 [Stachybotrys chartarum IBT 40293]
MDTSILFQPLQIGRVTLGHRVVMAPLTRFRFTDDHILLPSTLEYYTQRASVPGTLIIAESSLIAPDYGDFPNAPGIWNDAQIQSWKRITDVIHTKGCHIICQLNAPGRAGIVKDPLSPNNMLRSSSAVSIDSSSVVPKSMSVGEIRAALVDYAKAAKNAIAAGFDGVEIHGANGYLVDQFTQDTCNKREDEWGGSVENRCRFGFEVAAAVVGAVGADRVGFRISPYSTYNGMRMEQPNPTFEYLVAKLKDLKLSYLHIIEPRVNNWTDVETTESIEYLMDIWNGTSPILVAGGYTAESARNALDKQYSRFGQVAVVFGRHFLANPDLPFRLLKGLPLNKYDRDSFYTPLTPKGYTDYPFHPDFVAENVTS